jgi:hypothetical protein
MKWDSLGTQTQASTNTEHNSTKGRGIRDQMTVRWFDGLIRLGSFGLNGQVVFVHDTGTLQGSNPSCIRR